MDQRSFILGMITAFCECVAGGCKRLALSPPPSATIYSQIAEEAELLIEKHGLLHYNEENLDLSENERFEWIVIAAQQETIEEYLVLRAKGYSPVKSLEAFYGVLSYNPEESVSTGYDAYKEYFEG